MSNFEQQVPSLNTCLSLLARGITMMTVFCWARDDDGNFLVISMYGVKPDRHVTPLCDAPRSKELLQALQDLEPSRFDVSWLALFDQPERLASLLLEAPMADYGHMSLGLLLAIEEGRGMQMMTGQRAWSKEEDVALESAVRQVGRTRGERRVPVLEGRRGRMGVPLYQGELARVGRQRYPDAAAAAWRTARSS